MNKHCNKQHQTIFWFNVANLVMDLLILYVRILCFCNVWTEKKNVYRKTGNGIAFAGKQRYVDISCQNSVFTPLSFTISGESARRHL